MINNLGNYWEVKVVAHLIGLLKTAESEVALLGKLWIVLMSGTAYDSIVELRILFHNVFSIDLWNGF